MYRITPKSTGTYGNVVIGWRYCLFKHTVKNLLNCFTDAGCTSTIEKFEYIGHGTFTWHNVVEVDGDCEYFYFSEEA